MKNIVDSVYKSLENENWYAALFVTLTLPDICCGLRDGKTSGKQYANWFESNLPQYNGFLSGNDCYALRCALLHLGTQDISDQHIREVLEYFIFLAKGPHLSLFKNSIFGSGKPENFLQLEVRVFCEDMCKAVETWLSVESKNLTIQNNMRSMIEIHKPGYVHRNAVKFSNE